MSRKPNGRSNAHEAAYDALSTRRRFLLGTATAASVGLAGCSSGGGQDGTPTPTDEGSMDETATPEGMEESGNPDVDVLNYALTLEHLEHAFYRDGLEALSEDDLRNSDQVSKFGETVRMEVPGRLDTIRAHEKGHVDALTGVVEDLGGEPAAEAEYTFSFESATDFIATAKVLENTGVAAYKGAAPAVKSNEILASALGIHSVESRHASFLNALNDTTPFPKAVDAAKTPDEVTKAANPFFEADIAGSVSSLSSDGEPTAARKEENDTNDVDVLNYALTLEHLENAFYRDGLKALSDEEIRNAEVLSEFDAELVDTVPDRLRSVQSHEKAHVDAITSTIEDLGGDPVAEAEYTFEYDSATKFLGTAQVLENVGVAAYAGAAPTVKADAVFKAAAGIHSVEARHAGFLNELNGETPYPNAVDAAMTMEEVREAAGQFIQS